MLPSRYVTERWQQCVLMEHYRCLNTSQYGIALAMWWQIVLSMHDTPAILISNAPSVRYYCARYPKVLQHNLGSSTTGKSIVLSEVRIIHRHPNVTLALLVSLLRSAGSVIFHTVIIHICLAVTRPCVFLWHYPRHCRSLGSARLALELQASSHPAQATLPAAHEAAPPPFAWLTPRQPLRDPAFWDASGSVGAVF